LEDLGLDGMMMMMMMMIMMMMELKEVGLEGVDWIRMAQDRDQCQCPVNTLMHLHIP
jgi:hypothetical protein